MQLGRLVDIVLVYMAAFMAASFVAVHTYAVPSALEMFRDFGVEPPALTRFVLSKASLVAYETVTALLLVVAVRALRSGLRKRGRLLAASAVALGLFWGALFLTGMSLIGDSAPPEAAPAMTSNSVTSSQKRG